MLKTIETNMRLHDNKYELKHSSKVGLVHGADIHIQEILYCIAAT